MCVHGMYAHEVRHLCVLVSSFREVTWPPPSPFCYGLFLNIPCAGWFTGTFPSRMCVIISRCFCIPHCTHLKRNRGSKPNRWTDYQRAVNNTDKYVLFICMTFYLLVSNAENQPQPFGVFHLSGLALAYCMSQGCSSCPPTSYSPDIYLPPSFWSANYKGMCKCARTDPGERKGIFPYYPILPLDSPLLFPFLPHSSVPPLPSHPSSYLCVCLLAIVRKVTKFW